MFIKFICCGVVAVAVPLQKKNKNNRLIININKI